MSVRASVELGLMILAEVLLSQWMFSFYLQIMRVAVMIIAMAIIIQYKEVVSRSLTWLERLERQSSAPLRN